jgi:type IV pilus assembly protein PilV
MATVKIIRRRGAPRRANSGVMLIEALVGILIFALGVLAIVGLQASMTKVQTSSKFRGDASYLANGLLGTMWADDITNNLTKYTSTAACAAYGPCNDWNMKVAAALPGGSLTVGVPNVAYPNDVTVTINWTVPNEGAHTYTTSASLQP